MKAPLPVCSLVLGFCVAANAEPPIFDIPRIDGVTIDGKGDDWGEKGFRVDMMASQTGEVRAPQDFDAKFQLGWDEHGLLVLVTVHERKITEADDPRDLFQKDCVKMMMGVSPESPQFFRVTAGTGADPKFPSVRTSIDDRRIPAPVRKPEVEIAATRNADGYTLEARLPWSNLAFTPKLGKETAFHLSVNDVDESGSRLTVTWCPCFQGIWNPMSLLRLRLAAAAGPAIRTATQVFLDQGRPRADIIGPADFAGKTVTATANGSVFSTCKFRAYSGRARASLFLPPETAATISCGEGASTVIEPGDVDTLVSGAIDNVRVVFNPCVFGGEGFPQCEFDLSEAARSLGQCVMKPTFYDADYHEVKTAVKPGRYGAIVEVKTQTGQTFKRFVTLYRTQREIDWRAAKFHVGAFDMPPELGLEPAALAERTKEMDAYFKDQMLGSMPHSDNAAVLFAALNELKPGGELPRNRNSAYAANQRWWYGLKKQTGNLRNDYYAHLPAAYESDTKKKWPLILFLHGSGERGYDIEDLMNNGLPRNVDVQPNFSAIVIAPQCSPDEWWSPPELNDFLDRVEAKYRVDASRVYLTGLSMGGYGAWSLAVDSPGRFAAVVPICGGGDPEDVERIKNVPIWVFHGGKDPTVPIQRSQEMVDALKKIGGNVKFTVFPEAGHDSWTEAYAMPELYDWLLKQRLAAGSQ